MELYTHIAAVVVVLLYILAFTSAFEAILQARTSQGAIAWVMSLIAFPFVTVPIYLVFGRSRFAGYQEQRDFVEAESLRLIERTSNTVAQHIVPLSPDRPVYTSLLRLARMPATSGNEVQLLIDGQATFDSIAACMARARKHILFQFYIIRDDDLGRRMGRILADKAREGCL